MSNFNVKSFVTSGTIRNTALTNLLEAIGEHRWEDSLYYLELACAMAQNKISPYFLWRASQLIVSNFDVPETIQLQIVQTIFNSSTPKQDIALEWLIANFNTANENEVDQVFQRFSKSKKGSLNENYAGNLFRAYHALYFYFKWKTFSISSRGNQSMNESEELTEEDLESEKYKLGQKVFMLLKNACSFMHSIPSETKKGTSKKRKRTEEETEDEEQVEVAEEGQTPNSSEYEWLLVSLLDVAESLKEEDANLQTSGILLVEDYALAHRDHLPSLVACYRYIRAQHPQELTIYGEILKRIVHLSPENILVLDYVDHLLSCVETTIKDQDMNCEFKTQCFPKGKVRKLAVCVRHLCAFLEYRMWWTSERGWTALTAILKMFQTSWVNCWSCAFCEDGRERLELATKDLSLWPKLFWDSTFIKAQFKNHPKIIVSCAFTAFIFGYKENFVQNVLNILDKEKFSEEKRSLESLLNPQGTNSRDLKIYLLSRRKKRPFYNKLFEQTSETVVANENEDEDHYEMNDPMEVKLVCYDGIKFENTAKRKTLPYLMKFYPDLVKPTSAKQSVKKDRTKSTLAKQSVKNDETKAEFFSSLGLDSQDSVNVSQAID